MSNDKMNNDKKIQINGGYPLHTFDDVKNIYEQYIKNDDDRKAIEQAYAFVIEKHQGQLRKSGEPYYHHLIEVAYILAEYQHGPNTIIAGLLHDVVEDTNVTIEEIQKKWGSDVAKLVDALTKIQRLKLSKITSEEFEAEDHRKIFLGMAKDIRVILVKLADRLHNMRTLAVLSPERQQALSKETMEVFLPIASRLGLDHIKSELGELCLKYLEPQRYQEIKKLLTKRTKTLKKNLDTFSKKIADILYEAKIPFEISFRVKSIDSIYDKMYNRGHSFDEIYDIMALRIITDTEIQCYEILGLIHKVYKPLPKRFKDYIASPKTNMYQSLHTTVLSGDGNFYEVQIRTKDMDSVAENGIAAHWAYKEGHYNSEAEQKEIENQLHWFRDFVSITDNSDKENAQEYINNLTQDIFEANVYVFSPKGKVIELPSGSTPIDFAYRIHTKVGDNCVGAMVNGMMVPLNTILKTGDMVDIKTSKNSKGPNEGWLEFVKSASAKSCIRKFLAKKNADMVREEKIAKGRQACIDMFTERGVPTEQMLKLVNTQEVLSHFECETLDDLFISVCNKKPSSNAIVDFLNIKKTVSTDQLKTKTQTQNNCPVYCKGVSKIAISLANCCSPIPGDDIVGYITKGKGISVHRKNCPNISNESERLIDVYWREDIQFATFSVDLSAEANDRPNLLSDIMGVLTTSKVPVSSIHASLANGGNICIVSMTISVSDAKRLRDIQSILLSVKGIYKVIRVIH
ncbi:MAG: bifunctional (p)ppGpp synthetase/guanosine-3',5'-bis(diphosphate) 3'-pyrophosphohydrolase [Bacilli bacterium]|nr:bifunctional (p)ppGpp synthetase/guanosine-3',5'-bis(diphosphate) 3'-pyrophosphohydrolase [Bacilli bacterium]